MSKNNAVYAALSFAFLVFAWSSGARAEYGYCGQRLVSYDRVYLKDSTVKDRFGRSVGGGPFLAVFAVAAVDEKEAGQNKKNCAKAKQIATQCIKNIMLQIGYPEEVLTYSDGFSVKSWSSVMKEYEEELNSYEIPPDHLQIIQDNKYTVYAEIVRSNVVRGAWYMFDCGSF